MKVNSKIHPSSESVSDSEKLWSNHPFPPSKNISLERFTARSGKEPQVPLRLVPSLQSLSRQATAKKLILFLQKLINLTKYQHKLLPKKIHQLNLGYLCLCPVKLEDLFHFLPPSRFLLMFLCSVSPSGLDASKCHKNRWTPTEQRAQDVIPMKASEKTS